MLSLSENPIKSLDVKAFDGLRDLTVLNVVLNIYRNDLESINVGLFEGLDKIEILVLSRNKIKDLPTNVFTPLEAYTPSHLKETWLKVFMVTRLLAKVIFNK